MRGEENAGCEKCGVWKIRRKFQFSISISGEMQRNSVLTIKKKKTDGLSTCHYNHSFKIKAHEAIHYRQIR